MRFRLNLQWTILLLVAGGMTGTLLLSAYLHRVITGSLVEEDRYNAAVSQVVGLAERVVALELLKQPDRLQRDMALMTNEGSDVKQIDVYRGTDTGTELAATSDPRAPRLATLDENARDNELGELERPLPDVVTIEVMRHGARYWMISARVREGSRPDFVTALVRKNSYSVLVSQMQFQHNLVLATAIAVCVGLLYLLFAQFFRRPAREIAQAMGRARGGDLSSRAEMRRHDELGEIARRFNEMMEDLSARDREREALVRTINSFNLELRGQVGAATHDLRAANEALFDSQQRLARSETLAALGQVAGSLAHEIGTPLNSISGHLQLLERRLSDDADATRRFAIIGRQLDFIVGTVRALLQRVRRPWVGLRLMDLNDLVGEVLWLVTPTLDAHAIAVTSTLAGSLPQVLADRDRLHQVFLNLINNSIDAMPNGGTLEIATRLDEQSRVVEITVRDTGIGIPAGGVDCLFEPLWTTKAAGGGFGLAIAREIMIQHGGAIGVDRQTTNGTVFWLRLPLAQTAEAAS
jgi:two-component system NtrC family sensor kinase